MLRYKITVLFILLISICTFNFVEAGTNELPLLGKEAIYQEEEI